MIFLTLGLMCTRFLGCVDTKNRFLPHQEFRICYIRDEWYPKPLLQHPDLVLRCVFDTSYVTKYFYMFVNEQTR